MPYLKQEIRQKFNLDLNNIFQVIQREPHENWGGILNFIVTWLVKRCLYNRMKYRHAETLIGALECCKLEIYRKLLADYENSKEAEMGKFNV
jgi:hypothetical protein